VVSLTSGYGGGPVRDNRYGPRYTDPRYNDPRYNDPRYDDPRYGDPRYGHDPYGGHPPYRDKRPGVEAGRLWAGGVATAVIAALTAIVGLLIAHSLFNVTVLQPEGQGVWVNADSLTYAVIAAFVALLATALMHLLCLAVPSPGTFFSWIMVLLMAIAVVVPLTLTVPLSTKIATAAINLVIGVAITIVIQSMAASAQPMYQRRRSMMR
jgi:magnesium-transporting ATPase (P-type)